MMTCVGQLMARQRALTSHHIWSKQMMASLLQTHPLVCHQMTELQTTINYMHIHPIDLKFLLIGYSDGTVTIDEVVDHNRVQLKHLVNKKVESNMNRCQWYSVDSGMFAATSSESVSVLDTNTMKRVDIYRFANCRLYWSDWSPNTTTSIAVSSSSSTIRIIDIRSGSSLQNITCRSITGSVNHDMTRVMWSPLDSDCLIAGDSCGYLHIYDIRQTKRPVTVVGSDDMSFEPITALELTKDNMSVITAKGRSNQLNVWHFNASNLSRSDINFECPVVRSKQSKHNLNNSYLRCQLFVTENYIFSPNEHKVLGSDIISYDMTSGLRAQSLTTTKEGSFNTMGPNCVTGLDSGSLVLFTGGHRRLCVWTQQTHQSADKRLNQYYSDRWSDSE